jgi:uncharacterized integral membrane protein
VKTAAAIASTLALTLAAIAAALATASGAIDAVNWARHSFGTIPVALVGAFVAGATITHAVEHARAAHQAQPARRPGKANR